MRSARNTQGFPGATVFGTMTVMPVTPHGLLVVAS